MFYTVILIKNPTSNPQPPFICVNFHTDSPAIFKSKKLAKQYKKEIKTIHPECKYKIGYLFF